MVICVTTSIGTLDLLYIKFAKLAKTCNKFPLAIASGNLLQVLANLANFVH